MTYKRPLPNRKSTRIQNRDYSKGAYAVTICTRDRECIFGNAINCKMELTEIGQKARELWIEIPNKFENIKLDEFVLMPNHVHGIIIVGNYWEYVRRVVSVSDAINRVPTGKNNPMLCGNSLPKIIRWYKGRCSFEIRKMMGAKDFGWQSRYYDQVILSRKELNEQREYIRNNPSRWEFDRLNGEQANK